MEDITKTEKEIQRHYKNGFNISLLRVENGFAFVSVKGEHNGSWIALRILRRRKDVHYVVINNSRAFTRATLQIAGYKI